MLIVPIYLLLLVPVLIIWWTHRRCERREYGALIISFLAVMITLFFLSDYRRFTATNYAGPLAGSGICTIQIPIAILAATLITAVPIKMKLFRDFIAFLVGEAILLHQTWIS